MCDFRAKNPLPVTQLLIISLLLSIFHIEQELGSSLNEIKIKLSDVEIK